MKINVLDKKGKVLEEITLDKGIFGIKPNLEVVSQYIRVYNANQRQGTSSTKTRSAVSGGGKKPWKQKGTGRARQGSTRSPQWRTGGTVFGPMPKDYDVRMPQSKRRAALRAALAWKLRDGLVHVIDELPQGEGKTKA